MAHIESDCSKRETTVALKQEDSNRLCEVFNTSEWKNLD